MLTPGSPRSTALRVAQLTVGLVVAGIGIALMVAADHGIGPWDVLHQGLARVTGIPIGTVSIIVGIVVLLLWVPLRERPGIATVANVVLIGVTIDLTLWVLPEPDVDAVGWVMMLVGPPLFAVGSALYLNVGLGSGPRDGLMTGLARRGIPIAVARTGIEVTALALGWLLGGSVGVGTVWFAVSIGPLVAWFLPRLGWRWTPPPRDRELRRRARLGAR